MKLGWLVVGCIREELDPLSKEALSTKGGLKMSRSFKLGRTKEERLESALARVLVALGELGEAKFRLGNSEDLDMKIARESVKESQKETEATVTIIQATLENLRETQEGEA